MSNNKQAEKRHKQSLRNKVLNKSKKTVIKNLKKATLQLINSNHLEEATHSFQKLQSALDKTAKTGVIHNNKASRHKSKIGAKLKEAHINNKLN